MLLELRNLSAGYGRIPVLRGVSLHCNDGEVVALIGPNGAGKSTVLKAIFGFADITAGEVVLGGARITRQPAHSLLARGLAYVPQGRLVFGRLTVEENLRLGAYLEPRASVVQQRLEKIFQEFPVLAEKKRQPARTLSGGQQQLLALARARMHQPRLLLLDEPSLGLAPKVTAEIYAAIRRMREQGLALLIVEQNVHAVLALADRGYVLVNGQVRYEGSPETLLNPERLRELFLG